MGLWTERKRWTCRRDLKRRMWRSRWRGVMRDLSSIVGVLGCAVPDGGAGGAMSRPITMQLSGDHPIGDVLEPLQEFAKEAFGGFGIAPSLHENIERLAILIHGAPQVVTFPSEADEQFVKVPRISRPPPPMLELRSKRRPNLETPRHHRRTAS